MSLPCDFPPSRLSGFLLQQPEGLSVRPRAAFPLTTSKLPPALRFPSAAQLFRQATSLCPPCFREPLPLTVLYRNIPLALFREFNHYIPFFPSKQFVRSAEPVAVALLASIYQSTVLFRDL